ncbi:hypothetical protein F5Y18DRAFT_432329 [Xylariaceae sp. FL1019]|nr:hypothetical protein F5Y18DRAFT_432329 [Xylariaceae sp. FL1019]
MSAFLSTLAFLAWSIVTWFANLPTSCMKTIGGHKRREKKLVIKVSNDDESAPEALILGCMEQFRIDKGFDNDARDAPFGIGGQWIVHKSKK